MELNSNTNLLSLCVALLLCTVTHAAPKEGDVRLIRQDASETLDMGNVQIYHSGRWGAICDDGWTVSSANVACRMLGFRRALGHTKQSYFGKADKDYWLDDVVCKGTEANLLKCKHKKWGKHNCDSREAAGVRCELKIQAASGLIKPLIYQPKPPKIKSATQSDTTLTTIKSSTENPTTMNLISSTTNPTPTAINLKSSTVNPTNSSRTTSATTTGIAIRTTTTLSTTEQPTTTRMNTKKPNNVVTESENEVLKPSNHHSKMMNHLLNNRISYDDTSTYDLRVLGGRSKQEGRVEIRFHGGKWGVVCSDHWTLREAEVACRHAGLNYAHSPIQVNYFGGDDMDKLVAGVRCEGHEDKLYNCFHEQSGNDIVACPSRYHVAGVICTSVLPDLVPNATLLMSSSYLQDVQMYYLQCAMEEGCASSSAYYNQRHMRDWGSMTRRLLRFSSSTWNMGTADFRPYIDKSDWEWHSCHRHYHSMEVFAHYDILDEHGNRVAEGHKASFCLEDVQCLPGRKKKFRCEGFRDQGISVGCADDYLHDIDCQWIDMTDVEPGSYTFRIHINPDNRVAELNYDNNAVSCNLYYTGVIAKVTKCKISTKITKNKIV